MRSHNTSAAQGFTLIELSIVMVIIGLLVGGVLAGKSLIRGAELRSIVDTQQRIVTSVLIFKTKYDALPGDMVNATDFWGAADATPATCKITVGTGKATCNGDGNGKLEEHAGSYEWSRFWQHMANAEIFEGRYTGVSGGVPACIIAGPSQNIPRGKIAGTGFDVSYVGRRSGGADWFDGDYGNVIFSGAIRDIYPDGVVLTPSEMLNFDLKYDDGRPGGGTIREFKTTRHPNCADSDDGATAQYNTSYTSSACSVVFIDQF